VHVSVTGAFLHDADEVPRRAHKGRPEGILIFDVDLVRIIEHNQVDITGIIQFACAKLTEGEHDIA
jgi:hypothetical protein